MRMRIRTRLLLFNAAVIGVMATLLVVAAYWIASHQMRRETEGFLADEFHEYAHKYAASLDDLAALERDMRQHFTKARMAYPIFCRVYDHTGRAIVEVQNVSPAPPADAGLIRRALDGGELTYTLAPEAGRREFWCAAKAVQSPSGARFAFELGLDVHRLQRQIRRLRSYLLATVPVVLLISLAGAWWVTRHSMQPVARLLATVRTIRSTSLDKRLPVGGTGDEFDALALAVNEMLADIETGFSLAKEFTADAAHELRTPLAKLTIMLERSLDRALSPDQAKHMLDEAYEHCARLRRLVDNLLLLARLDRGEVEGKPVTCDLSEVLDDLAELWSAACAEREIELRLSAGIPLPVCGRPVLLRRVLANLMDNALRHTPRGGCIRVTAAATEAEVSVAVADSGPGIAPEDLGKVFERFFQADRARNTHGAGLGLSICLKIIDSHNGRIEGDSDGESGTTFTVTLPRVPSSATSSTSAA